MEARFEERFTEILHRTNTKSSLNTIDSTERAFKNIFKKLHRKGVTADVISRRESEILAMFEPQNNNLSVENQRDGETHLFIPANSTPTENETSSPSNQTPPSLGWALSRTDISVELMAAEGIKHLIEGVKLLLKVFCLKYLFKEVAVLFQKSTEFAILSSITAECIALGVGCQDATWMEKVRGSVESRKGIMQGRSGCGCPVRVPGFP